MLKYLIEEVNRFQGKHAAVLVREGDREAEIDIKIAPLIREMWKADIDTSMSCEAAIDGLVWIQFPSEGDLGSFLHIVLHYQRGRNSMYNRSVGTYCPSKPDLAWRFSIYPMDLAWHDECDGCGQECHEGDPDIEFEYNVYFPARDLPALLKRLRAYNKKKGATTATPGVNQVQDATQNDETGDNSFAQ